MTEGTLSEWAFKRYLVQEYAFVQACSGVLGYAIAKAPGFRNATASPEWPLI